MRTDRELLELAAKAAGVVGVFEHGFIRVPAPGFGNAGFICWNPLTDDGDAFRLMVKLRMWEDCDDGICCVESTDDHGGDATAATRRAIVRAAAEFGAQL